MLKNMKSISKNTNNYIWKDETLCKNLYVALLRDKRISAFCIVEVIYLNVGETIWGFGL